MELNSCPPVVLFSIGQKSQARAFEPSHVKSMLCRQSRNLPRSLY